MKQRIREILRKEKIVRCRMEKTAIWPGKWSLLWSILFFVSIWFIIGLSASAEEKTVKVGYYPVEGYQDCSVEGVYSGYGYDYYMQIRKYTRWNYEFVEASYAQCLQMLLNGEIDLMSGLAKTGARNEQMLFSNDSVSSAQNELYARADAELYYEDYEDFNGRSVALLKGTLHGELDQYAQAHDFQISIVEYDSMAEMEEALISGRIDMVYASTTDPKLNTKIVARMPKIPLYYAVNLQEQELADELNDALQKIIDNNPEFATQMAEKYSLDGANATAAFTKEELQYIASGQPVYVIVNEFWAPISWYDQETESFRGIAIDVLEKIEQYSGLNLIYCSEEDFNRLVPENPDIINHVLAILADDNAWAVTQEVMMSNHIVDATVVRVTKRSTHQNEVDEGTVVALPYRFYISWCLGKDIDESQIVYYDTVQECLDAINEGKADVTYVNELVSTYYLSMLEYSNLFATANSGYNENLAFAIHTNTQNPLLSIVDKSLLCIGNDELEEIVIRNSIAEQKVSLRGLYYSQPSLVITVLVVTILVVAAIIFSILYLVLRKKRMDQELQKEQETAGARTEFFMMISHEIRTPLNAIAGYLGLAQDECQKHGIDLEYLKRSRYAAKQLNNIADDMLDYTNIASGTAQVHRELFDLKEVVHNAEQNISVQAAKKNIKFRFTIGDINHEFVIGDHSRITQIMQNLLSNAVKFTPAGGLVNARVGQLENESGELLLRFTAQDNGMGMSEEFLKTVCEPFHQSNRAYSRTNGGLGLGLYLTKYYLNAMNGQLEVKSTLGEGSIFTVTIPLGRADSEQLVSRHMDLSKVRAIIATADEEEGAQLKEFLKRLKIKSDCMADAAQAAKRIRSRTGGPYEYSLCILEAGLLQADPEVLDTISSYEHVPVIYVMTDRFELVDGLSENRHITQVLYKPVFQSVLFDAVMNTFGEYTLEHETEICEDFGGIQVMIVEDNMINADILMRLLKKMNVVAAVCENGQLALEKFEQSPAGTYRMIFMDIQMPVMDGFETTERIRHSSCVQGAQIPIVAVSANAFPEDIEKSLQAGMNEHLSKPVNEIRLSSVMHKYLLHSLPSDSGEE